jgi:hypothetical protein
MMHSLFNRVFKVFPKCSEFNLTKVIKEPTRNGALLDPILVFNLDIVIDSEVISVNRDISDHDATLINLKIPCLLKRSYMRKVISLRFIFLQ